MQKILLVASTTGYQVHSFADAASKLGVDLVLATDRCHVLENPWGDHAVPLRFDHPASNLDTLASRGPFDGILAVGDQPACVAAHIAARLHLRFSSPSAVLAAKNKNLARRRFRAAGLNVPHFELVRDPRAAARDAQYPCVLKPVALSASRGVIRVNHAAEFEQAFARIQKILERETDRSIQLESFIPGREFALEGLLTNGRFQPLALFDKPDPLDGPFFEETIYVTPSREPSAIEGAIVDTTLRAARALGLSDGPAHAEMRVNDRGVWMLEIAARPIGGLCSRVLRFENGASLEEILLQHALGRDVSRLTLTSGAHAVMMIPIPAAGVYSGVLGLDEARAVPGIEDVAVTAKEGQLLVPLPEAASYLGFIFARASTPALAEQALREAHARLRFQLTPALAVVK